MGELERAPCGLESWSEGPQLLPGGGCLCSGWCVGVSLRLPLTFALSPGFSSSVPPAKAQGSKDGKPKQKVIIADCGEYV